MVLGGANVTLEQCREAIQTSDQNQVVIDLSDFIIELEEKAHGISELSISQQTIYYISGVTMEVNNGGFDQYYFNSSGNYAKEAVDAFRRIGSDDIADLVASANARFTDGVVSKDRYQRQDDMNLLEDQGKRDWNDLDNKFYEIQAPVDSLCIKYILTNLTDFLQPLPKK